MAKNKISTLTFAETEVLDFMQAHKGFRFTNEELEEKTGIRSGLMPDIMRSLRAKGYEIRTSKRSGKHELVLNNKMSYFITTAMFLVIVIIFIFAGLDYLEADPTAF